jgi:hypothetical protein
VNDSEVNERRQDDGAGHLHILRAKQHLPPVNSISDDATEERKEQNRNLLEKGIQPQEKR